MNRALTLVIILTALLTVSLRAGEIHDAGGACDLKGDALGDITAYDVNLVSSTIPDDVALLPQSGQTMPDQVDALLAAAEIANNTGERYRTYRLFCRAADGAWGEDKIEHYEVAASFGIALNRAIFTEGGTITLTLKPLFTLGHPLANRYTAESIGPDPEALRKRSGDMGLAFRSSTDGAHLHFRLYVPSGPSRAGCLEKPFFRNPHEKTLQQLAEKSGFIIAVPNGARGFAGPRGERDLMDLIDRLQAVYSIEPKRTFLLGWSLGGAAAWQLAMKSPGRFGAMASVTSAAAELNRENARAAADLPVSYGEPESNQSSEGAQRTRAQAAEMLHHFMFTSYPDTDHLSVWERRYRTSLPSSRLALRTALSIETVTDRFAKPRRPKS